MKALLLGVLRKGSGVFRAFGRNLHVFPVVHFQDDLTGGGLFRQRMVSCPRESQQLYKDQVVKFLLEKLPELGPGVNFLLEQKAVLFRFFLVILDLLGGPPQFPVHQLVNFPVEAEAGVIQSHQA